MKRREQIRSAVCAVASVLLLACSALGQGVEPPPSKNAGKLWETLPPPQTANSAQPAPKPEQKQPKPVKEPPAREESLLQKIVALASGGPKSGLEMRVSVNVRDMNLSQAVRLLAEQAGVNVAVGKDVDGKVTCNLTNVTTRVALEAMLHSNGYTFVERDGVLIVIKQGDEKKFDKAATSPRTVRKTFHIPYTGNEKEFVAGSPKPTTPKKAEKTLEDIIREMLSPRGKMVYYERQHIIVVEDYEPNVVIIEEFVKQLWDVPAQVFIDARLIEVTLEDGEDLGIRWNIVQKVGSSGKRSQKTGVLTAQGTTLEAAGPSLGLSKAFTFGIVNANVEAVLEALAIRERVDLVSNPNVMVMNHRMASIVVGQEIPYLSTEESTGGNPIRTYEFKEVVIRLDVTPHIGGDGMIFLDVHPAVKSVIGYTKDPAIPILSTREAVTNVAVMDGSTLIIGGLVQRNATKSRTEVPWLGRALGWIPILGLPFRQKSDSDVKNDLIFLLTPRIVRPETMQEMMKQKEHLLEEPPPHPSENPGEGLGEEYVREKLGWEAKEE